MIALFLLLAHLAGAGDFAPAEKIHPLSFAKLAIECSDTEVRFELRIQDLTLADTLDWELDLNFDNAVTRDESDLAMGEFLDYLATDLWFEINGTIWRPSPNFLAYETASGHNAPDSMFYTHLVVGDAFHLDDPLQELAVHSDLFYARGNPIHRMHVSVSGLTPDDEALQYLMSAKARDAVFQAPIHSAPPGLLAGKLAFSESLKHLPLIALVVAAAFCAESFSFSLLSFILLLVGLNLAAMLANIGDVLSPQSASLSLALLSLAAAAGIRLNTHSNTASMMSWHGVLFLGALLLGGAVSLEREFLFESSIGFSIGAAVWFLGSSAFLVFLHQLRRAPALQNVSEAARLIMAQGVAFIGLYQFGSYAQNSLQLPIPSALGIFIWAGLAATLLMRLPGKGSRHAFGAKAVLYATSLLGAFTLGQLIGLA